MEPQEEREVDGRRNRLWIMMFNLLQGVLWATLSKGRQRLQCLYLLRVDRKGRAPEYIARPALTVGLAVQPEVLRSLSDQPGFRGRGLLARFFYSLPASRVGGRRTDVLPLPDGVRETYAAELKALASSLEEVGTGASLLRLSRQAEAELLAFADALEPLLGENGDLGYIADWGCKLVGGLGRVAALLHLAANVRRALGEAVGPESVRAAIRIGRYLIPHALMAFDLMEADPNLTLARRVLHWILTKELTSFSRRDCFESMKGRVRRVEALDPILNVLEAHGYVRRRVPEPRRRGRPPAPVFDVNPLVAKFAQTGLPTDSANSANFARGSPPPAVEARGATCAIPVAIGSGSREDDPETSASDPHSSTWNPYSQYSHNSHKGVLRIPRILRIRLRPGDAQH